MKRIPLYEVRKITTLREMLETSTDLFSKRTAFLSKHKGNDVYEPVTYRQFKRDVDSFGTALVGLNLKDKRIALIGENRYEWAVAYMAVVNGAGLIVPLDKELPENETESLLSRPGPSTRSTGRSTTRRVPSRTTPACRWSLTAAYRIMAC
jgi:long-chain acyl-CoA synthetase